MSVDLEARSIVLVSRQTGEMLSRFDIPPNVEITFELPSMAHPRLVFDSRGRSADYAVVIRIEATGTRLVFHGLTGDVSITEVAS